MVARIHTVTIRNNPDARGFIIETRVQVYGPFIGNVIKFNRVDVATAGTKRAAEKIAADFKAVYADDLAALAAQRAA